MAQVDFSNARIAPAVSAWGETLVNPTRNANVSLANNDYIYNSSGNQVASLSRSQLINQQKQLMYLYQGTFTTSGTEFYLADTFAGWKVSNISFSNGDTYVFQINASLVCN